MRLPQFNRLLQNLYVLNQERWNIAFVQEIDASGMDWLREAHRRKGLSAPSYMAIIIKVIAAETDRLAKRYPELNSSISRLFGFQWITRFDGISAGVAVSREENGLDRGFNLVISNPQKQSVAEIADRLNNAALSDEAMVDDYRKLKKMMRLPNLLQRFFLRIGLASGRIHAACRGTFAITSVGKLGVDLQASLPMSAPIQWGFGAIKDRPVVRNGQLRVGRTLFFTIAFDRCLLNGRPICELLNAVQERLESLESEAESNLRGALDTAA